MWIKKKIIVPVEISARHCHLCKADLEKLFGQGYELQKLKQLSQPSDFACQETLEIQVGSKKFEKVRIVGPLRSKSQVEISLTDAVGSGITPPVKLSGQLGNTAQVALRGPAGAVDLNEGLIVALHHIHCNKTQAAKLGLKNGDKVNVRVEGMRAVVFEDVVVRAQDDYKLCMHVDTDEGNAAGIDKIGEGIIL